MKTPALMVQGTSSHAGKSLMAAALCRILRQDGFHPAPFKAQNMALNSFVTLDGLELARAQALQAKACGMEPDVRMNPVLLKPAQDDLSQVVCMGKPLKTIQARDWMAFSPEAKRISQQAYDSLAAEHDVMVLEGAGSPAEINLRPCDYTNMDMARHADAAVLLVGDIDRGGVLASLVGTMAILSDWEQTLVFGFVLNKFRGEPALLTGAIEYLAAKTNREVLGVIPYLRDLQLPEEDGFEWPRPLADRSEGRVAIGVVALPHLSNVSDFDPLRLEPDVDVHLVRRADDLDDGLAAVVLPGSKQVKDDLDYLNESGISERLRRFADAGRTEIVGICGGLQMLGRELRDPHGVESGCERFPGLNLLNLTTVLEREKCLQRVRGTHQPSGLALEGYEIHHGRTLETTAETIVVRSDGSPAGFGNQGLVWGTYVHGLFDCDAFRSWFIDQLRKRQGLPERSHPAVRYDLEPALDRLAEAVRTNLAIKKIYQRLGFS